MTQPDTSHLVALERGLSKERGRLAAAATDAERAIRSVWVSQLEREVAFERQFLGMPADAMPLDISDDDLLAELLA